MDIEILSLQNSFLSRVPGRKGRILKMDIEILNKNPPYYPHIHSKKRKNPENGY